MEQAIEHDQMEAILMSLSAIAIMAHTQHGIWETNAWMADRTDLRESGVIDQSNFRKWRDRDSYRLRRLCQLLDEAMNYIGDCLNGSDAADEHQMTDAAFAAMRRALREHEQRKAV